MKANRPEWHVRRATEEDIEHVAAVADAAWRDTYVDLLRPDTIDAFLHRAYSSERLRSRIASHHFWVASHGGQIVGFADVIEHDDRLELAAIYVLPSVRGSGAGTMLLRELDSVAPALPITADVILGNRKGETFYEHRGFAPHETVETELFGEGVTERRWWLVRGGTHASE